MDNIFAELQRQSLSDSEIEQHRKTTRQIVDIYRSLPNQREFIGYFAELRELPVSILDDMESFFVDEDYPIDVLPENLRHQSYGWCNGWGSIYDGRYVFPVKDAKGNVAGFVGYDKFEEPKYLDSKNYGYKAKDTMLFGMENMEKIYRDGYVVVVEGPICNAYLRSENINSLATLGSYMSPYALAVLKRIPNVLVIADADEAGSVSRSKARKNGLRCLQSTIAKDVDDSRKVNPFVADEIRKLLSNRFYMSSIFK